MTLENLHLMSDEDLDARVERIAYDCAERWTAQFMEDGMIEQEARQAALIAVMEEPTLSFVLAKLSTIRRYNAADWDELERTYGIRKGQDRRSQPRYTRDDNVIDIPAEDIKVIDEPVRNPPARKVYIAGQGRGCY